MEQTTAKLNDLRMAPRKVRLVVDVVRGMGVHEAEAQLMMMDKRAANPILKLLRSAMANAKNLNMTVPQLIVSAIRVDQGQTLKRSLPRARGSASPIHKMSSHITITLSTSKKELKQRFLITAPEKKVKNIDRKSEARSPKSEKSVEKKPLDKTQGKSVEEVGFMRRVFMRKSG